MKDHKNNKPGQMDKNKKPISKEDPTHQSNKSSKNEKPNEDQDQDSKNERKLSSRQ